jgi:hypothetical protein
MANLLSTLVSNVRGVTTWLSEHNDAPEQDIEKLLHAAGVDDLLSNRAGFYLAYGTARCLCSYLTATERSSMYTVTEDDGKWKLVCKHPRCAAIGADTRLANRWKYQRTLSADLQLFNGAADDLDTMQILTEHAVALREWSCASRLTLAETYLLSPAEATHFIRDMISHEHGPWAFIQQYAVVHMLWLNESDLKWIAVMFDARTMEIWLCGESSHCNVVLANGTQCAPATYGGDSFVAPTGNTATSAR